MSTYNSFPSINTGNFRITAANPYLKAVDMPSIDNHTYFKFGKAYTPAHRYNPEDYYSWQEHMFDYADPLAINSVVDAAFNSQAKRQRYGLGNNVAADVVATVPALLELTYNSSIKPYYANIKHAIDSEEYGIGEALGNAAMTAGLNTLMNIGETVDVLANPVKALVITTLTDKARLREEGKATDVLQALADSIGVGDRGRINYDYDLDPNSYADGLINVALEWVSDPFNWFSFGASSAIKSTAKEAVADAAESAAKIVVKDVAQETAEQVSKSVAKEITQETAERVAKEAAGEVFDTLSKRQQSLLVNNIKRALRDGNLDEAADIISKTVKNTLNGSTTGPFNRIRAHKWAGIDKAKFADEYVDSLINKITATTLENIDSLKTAQKIYNFSEGAQKILSKAALTTGAPGLIGSYKGIKYGMHAIEQHAAKLAKDAKLDTIEGVADAIAKAQEKFGTHADADVRKHLIDFYQSKGYSKVVATHLTKKTIAKYTTQAARASALQYRQLVTNLAVFKNKYDAAMKTLVDADMPTRVKTLQPIYEELADTVSNAEEMLTSLKKLRETNMFSDTIEDYIKVLEDVVADAKADSPYKKTLQELISEMDETEKKIKELATSSEDVIRKHDAIDYFDELARINNIEGFQSIENINDLLVYVKGLQEKVHTFAKSLGITGDATYGVRDLHKNSIELIKDDVHTITAIIEKYEQFPWTKANVQEVLNTFDIMLTRIIDGPKNEALYNLQKALEAYIDSDLDAEGVVHHILYDDAEGIVPFIQSIKNSAGLHKAGKNNYIPHGDVVHPSQLLSNLLNKVSDKSLRKLFKDVLKNKSTDLYRSVERNLKNYLIAFYLERTKVCDELLEILRLAEGKSTLDVFNKIDTTLRYSQIKLQELYNNCVETLSIQLVEEARKVFPNDYVQMYNHIRTAAHKAANHFELTDPASFNNKSLFKIIQDRKEVLTSLNNLKALETKWYLGKNIDVSNLSIKQRLIKLKDTGLSVFKNETVNEWLYSFINKYIKNYKTNRAKLLKYMRDTIESTTADTAAVDLEKITKKIVKQNKGLEAYYTKKMSEFYELLAQHTSVNNYDIVKTKLNEVLNKVFDIYRLKDIVSTTDTRIFNSNQILKRLNNQIKGLNALEELNKLEKHLNIEQGITNIKTLRVGGYDYTPINKDTTLPYTTRYNIPERLDNIRRVLEFKVPAQLSDKIDTKFYALQDAVQPYTTATAEDVVKTIDLYESKAISDTFDKVYKTAKPHKDFEVPVSKLAEQVQEDVAIIKRACEEDPLFLEHLQNYAKDNNLGYDIVEYIEELSKQLEQTDVDFDTLAVLDDIKQAIKDYNVIKRLQADSDMYAAGTDPKNKYFKSVDAPRNAGNGGREVLAPKDRSIYRMPVRAYSLETVTEGFKEDVAAVTNFLKEHKGTLSKTELLAFYKKLNMGLHLESMIRGLELAIKYTERYNPKRAAKYAEKLAELTYKYIDDVPEIYRPLIAAYFDTTTFVSNLEKYITGVTDANIEKYYKTSLNKESFGKAYMSPSTQRDLYEVSKRYYNLKPNGAVEGLVNARKEAEAGIKVYAASLSKVFTSSQIRNIADVGALVKAWANKDISNPIVELLQKYKGQITVEDSPLYHAYQTITDTLDRAVFLDEVSYKLAQIPDDALPKEIRFALVDALHSNTGSKVAAELLEDMPKFIDKLCEKARVQLLCRKSKFKYSLDAIQDTMHDMFPGNDDIVKAVQDLIDEAQKTGASAHDALFDVKVTEALMDYVDELRTPKALADSHIRVTFDIETTGTNPADGQLLQIAARCTVDGKVYEFNTLVKSDTHIAFDLEAKLTGMKTTDRNAVAKAFEQKFMAAANGNEFTGLEAFYNWLTDVQKAAGEGHNKILLCGQNIDNFDIDFIKQRIDFLTSRKANTSLTNLKNMLDNADTFDTLIAYYDRDGVPYLTNTQRDFIQQTFSEYFKKLQGADWTQRIKFGEYLDGDFISACDDFCKIIKSDEVYRYGKDLATAGINETSELSKLVSEIRKTFEGIRKTNADYSTYRAFIGEHELNIMSRLYNLEDGQLMVSPRLSRDMRSVSAFYELPEVISETDADILTHFVKKIKNNREYIRCSSSIRKSKNFLVQAKEVIRDLIDNKKIFVPGAQSTGGSTARLCYEAYNDGKDCVALLKTMTYKQGAKKALVDSLDTLLKEGKIDLDTYDIIRRNCDDVYNKTKLAQSAAPDIYLTDIRDTTEALEDLAKDPHKGLDAIITNRNLWSAGEASSKVLLRSTCDNFKTIAKILEPMDVKEAAAITESIKNAGALFTAHQLQDLVNKTADDLLKELHLSAGVKVVHTDYKAISNEVLDAWRANGILCEEVVNDMGSTSACTYWIVADKSKYDYAKLVELGEDTTINPVFIEDITGNAEIDKLLVDNRNILAKHSPTLGATDGSRITDAIYSRVYAACPESLKGNLLTVEELHNAKFFDKNYCNHMVIGDAASHKKYNLLYTDDVTMSHRFNIQDAVAQQETVIKYTECFMNSDMSLRTGALFKDLPDKTKLEIIRHSEGCKVAFLAPNKHAKYGYEIRTMDVYNLKTLKLAEDVDAVILPQMTILTMQRVVNKYEMPAIMKILTIPAMLYKCGYLGSLGFLFRNLTGGLINNTITAGSPLELPHTVNHWFNTVKLYREYTIVCNKITALGADAVDVLYKLSDYGTVKRVITELAQNGEIKMLDPAAFMDVHKFIRHGPSAGLCESVQDTLAAFIEAEGGKQYDSVLNKVINKTAEAAGNLPILKQINTANGWIEQTLRLSLYLQEIERGSSISQAIAKVIKTHFDYSTKPLYMHYAELVVPFLSFTMNNLAFYADTFNRFGWFAGTVVDAFKPTWDFDALSDPNHKDYYSYDRGFDWGDLVSTRNRLPHGKISMARLYHTLVGNIILPTEKDVDYYNGYTEEVERRKLSLIFKLNPSFMDAFNFLCDPISSVTDRILPYYTWGPEIALKLLNEEASVSDVALGTIAENLPIIGPVLQRTGFGHDIIGKGAESKNIIDKVKDSSNPLLAISSMFGTMYEKPAVTYSNSNRWGGVKKYNRARYFKLTQPGTTKQGSHRSSHPSNYRKGIYDMSSKSELDKRMYITSNPNIRYRIRDYYRRYI